MSHSREAYFARQDKYRHFPTQGPTLRPDYFDGDVRFSKTIAYRKKNQGVTQEQQKEIARLPKNIQQLVLAGLLLGSMGTFADIQKASASSINTDAEQTCQSQQVFNFRNGTCKVLSTGEVVSCPTNAINTCDINGAAPAAVATAIPVPATPAAPQAAPVNSVPAPSSGNTVQNNACYNYHWDVVPGLGIENCMCDFIVPNSNTNASVATGYSYDQCMTLAKPTANPSYNNNSTPENTPMDPTTALSIGLAAILAIGGAFVYFERRGK